VRALLGTYDTTIDGLAITIGEAAGTLYATQTAGTPDELTAYACDEHTVGLRFERTRLAFTRSGDGIDRLTIESPGLTLEARRRVGG
jgi:hypothetical protein